jgi:hypothetical protein
MLNVSWAGVHPPGRGISRTNKRLWGVMPCRADEQRKVTGVPAPGGGMETSERASTACEDHIEVNSEIQRDESRVVSGGREIGRNLRSAALRAVCGTGLEARSRKLANPTCDAEVFALFDGRRRNRSTGPTMHVVWFRPVAHCLKALLLSHRRRSLGLRWLGISIFVVPLRGG